MVRVTYVTCPQCKKEYYLRTEDFSENRDANTECPFCTKEFKPEEGHPHPPFSRRE